MDDARAARVDAAQLIAVAVGTFRERLDELASRMADHLVEVVPELGDDPVTRRAWAASNRENVEAWLHSMTLGLAVPPSAPPPAASEAIESFILRGADLAVLLRVYRVGHGFAFDEWINVLRGTGAPAAVVDDVLRTSLHASFAYVDAVSAHIAESFARAHADAVRSADITRLEVIRSLVEGSVADADRAALALGYDLRRRHLGFVTWSEGNIARSRLERAASDTASALELQPPLVVSPAPGVLWAWCGGEEDVANARLDDIARSRRADAVSVSVGGTALGIHGFVRTHTDAIEARRLALLMRRRAGSVTVLGEHALFSLLTRDVAAARRFYVEQLGALAEADATTRRLRTTLQVFLEEGQSATATSRRLGVHQNTVKYRVRRCEELLGRPVGREARELAAALLLVDALRRSGPG